MSYATRQNMIDEFGETELIQLTDRLKLGVINAQVLERAFAGADAEINGHIASRYSLPLVSVPQLLVGYACDIARYKLFTNEAPQVVMDRYNQAMRYLEGVASGKFSLGADNAGETVKASGVASMTAAARVVATGSRGY